MATTRREMRRTGSIIAALLLGLGCSRTDMAEDETLGPDPVATRDAMTSDADARTGADVVDDRPVVTPPPLPVVCPPAPAPVLMASGLPGELGWELAIDDASLYVFVDRKLTRFPKCGGAGVALTAQEANPGSVIVQGATLYWLDMVLGGKVRTMPSNGGAPTTLYTAAGMGEPHSLDLVGDTLFFVVNAGFPSGAFSIPAMGGAPLYIGPGRSAIAGDASRVYTHVQVNGKWATVSMPRNGGQVKWLADSAQESSIAVDATDVFFTAWAGNAPGFVRAVPKGGGAAKDLATNQGIATYLVLDDTHVYWVSEGAAIRRAPKGGGTVEPIVENVGASALGLDAKSVYWATWDGTPNSAKLWRMDK